MMKAMIFAAGLGSRLRPLTDRVPKALVAVAGKTLLERLLDKLSAHDFGEVVVNVHHHARQIIAFLAAYPSPRWPLRVSDERAALLDTGGGLKRAFSSAADEPVLVHNVDILSNANLSDLMAQGAKCDVALLVSERRTRRYLLFDDRMRLVGWTDASTGEVRSPWSGLDVSRCRRLAFSGIHVAGPPAFAAMEGWPDRFGIVDFYVRNCRRLHIHGYIQQGLRLLDVGKMDALHHAEEFIRSMEEKP